ncbi:MAG: 2-oxoacid:acceptor oxidoreductase family protein [Chloroflexi bacterium]|nr:2-oxoacid:acceptor oxidoreductase family protein [Chloroflexota bacterium]MCL5107471.1 2-oxoacid:acceptor oxidoreductase family protein [Chloroflexota bacterium]MDA8219771.1 2-oxoacid:acceptor oxidoreductase family protein [Dehalococcoidales bacterium]
MNDRYEVRLAGVGGQGLQLAGLILAEAAAIFANKNAVQSQSYGAEARGGPSVSEVILGEGDIDYPKVSEPDLLLVLSQDAADRYVPGVRKDGLIIADAQHVERLHSERRVLRLPITETAKEATGRPVASIVALGVIAVVTGIIPRDAIRQAVLSRAPKGTEEMNTKALEAGFALGESALASAGKK